MNEIKNRLVYVIAILFAITICIPALNAENASNNLKNFQFTHTVLGEYCTTTVCGYCPLASDQIYQVYNMGYEFFYISLVGDKNSYASARISQLGFSGVPSVAFDGGNVDVTGQQSSSAPYENAVQSCGSRSVADIDLDLKAFWMGSGEIEVTIDVTNNEGSVYNGHIRVYVTEITSRWDDASGDPYHFAMINNYAINDNIQVGSMSTESYSDTWTGYSDISMNNIKVIASVFDQSSSFTDETTSANPEFPNTNPPSLPSQPDGPSSGCVGIEYTFSTSSTEPNGDKIKYGWDWDNDDDVDFWTNLYSSGQTVDVAHSFSNIGNYNIKVKAQDQFGAESGFSQTKQIQIGLCDPPNIPSIPNGEENGIHSTSYSYSTSTTDPNLGDKLFYQFDWGDGSNSQWLGPYDSGQSISKDHTWNSPGTFDVIVKAKDLADQESGWSNPLVVNMENTAPNKPSKPSGPTSGVIGIKYSYSTHSSDPEGDSIQYLFDWGDGTDSGWVLQPNADHIWQESGDFPIKVKARDNWDESEWSSYNTISIEQGDINVEVDADKKNAIIGEQIQFSSTVTDGEKPLTYGWDFGDGNISNEQNPFHVYEKIGIYTVSLSVEDDSGAFGSDFIIITINLSNPPEIPTIMNGPQTAFVGEPCDFTFITIDPNNDDVYILVDWGDNSESKWHGPYDSGDQIVLNHTWEQDGSYNIKAKSKDIYDFESSFSENYEININWQDAFLIGKISDKIEKENITEFNAQMVLYLSLNPIKFRLYSSNELIVISNDIKGIFTNNFLLGKFQVRQI